MRRYFRLWAVLSAVIMLSACGEKKEEPTVTEEEMQEEASASHGAEAAEESADEDFPDTRENESGQTMTDEEYQEYLERANSARWLAFELPEGWGTVMGVGTAAERNRRRFDSLYGYLLGG